MSHPLEADRDFDVELIQLGPGQYGGILQAAGSPALALDAAIATGAMAGAWTGQWKPPILAMPPATDAPRLSEPRSCYHCGEDVPAGVSLTD